MLYLKWRSTVQKRGLYPILAFWYWWLLCARIKVLNDRANLSNLFVMLKYHGFTGLLNSARWVLSKVKILTEARFLLRQKCQCSCTITNIFALYEWNCQLFNFNHWSMDIFLTYRYLRAVYHIISLIHWVRTN